MPDLTETQLRKEELTLEKQRLALEYTRLYIEFAKFGFGGTLTIAIAGLITILGLAALNVFTQAKIESWVIFGIAAFILIGSIAFGYLSLWELPRIVTKVNRTGTDITLGPGNERTRRE
jgi:hypothetical protein